MPYWETVLRLELMLESLLHDGPPLVESLDLTLGEELKDFQLKELFAL